MINPEELFIGARFFSSTKNEEVKINSLNVDSKNNSDVVLKEYLPIPLTDNKLLELGFLRKNLRKLIGDDYIVLQDFCMNDNKDVYIVTLSPGYNNRLGEWGVSITRNGEQIISCSVKYVHELQRAIIMACNKCLI